MINTLGTYKSEEIIFYSAKNNPLTTLCPSSPLNPFSTHHKFPPQKQIPLKIHSFQSHTPYYIINYFFISLNSYMEFQQLFN